MSLPGLTIIGERINPGFAKSKAMLEKRDISALQELAMEQVQKGANYLTFNLGETLAQERGFVSDLIRALQEAVDVPLAFDYPHRSVQENCLRVYDPAKARGGKPIVNSISELRWEMLKLARIQPIRVVLMASERLVDGTERANRTAAEIAETAHRLVERVLEEAVGLSADDLLIDVSLCPLASDTEGQVKRALEAIELISKDASLRGVHVVVGLSNLGIMLPKQAKDGSVLSVKLESAFLTLAMRHGLDTILGTAGRKYEILGDDDFVFRGFKKALEFDGFEMLMALRELYRTNRT